MFIMTSSRKVLSPVLVFRVQFSLQELITREVYHLLGYVHTDLGSIGSVERPQTLFPVHYRNAMSSGFVLTLSLLKPLFYR